ncbi:myelin expression factor 2-like isoform X2 [Diorhabda carinulata]|uniref:myelin expression factor 2-like isoform X2 n=1 Tax=Diorhabda carinulata TaxID=1163345 RepID=UPI0025A0F22F|nr:myelin expression factor 2-like isoform X2 [Diorhabda carinulata]XP_057671460.1 myelin expression factor 2-like isoform X2 [Diorhabda carinulata]
MSDTEDNKEHLRDRTRRDRSNRSGGGGVGFRDRSRDRGSNRDPRSLKPSQTRVYVSNIPYEFRWQDVKDLFREQVGDVQFVELFFDDFDKPKGSGIVEFPDKASVDKCMEIMQRYEVKGRKLVIKEDFGVTRDRHGAIVSGNSRRGDRSFDRGGSSNMSMRNDEGRWGNTYGLSPQFLESLKIDPPLGNKIFVANLDYGVDKKKVKEAFRLAGKLTSVDLPLDKDGRIKGYAIIEYDHPVEAVQAISMFNGQSFYDRTITVRMDRASDMLKLPEGLKSIGMGLGPNGEPLKCVAHNLPSLSSNAQCGGANNGILGTPSNLPLGVLSGLGNIGTLGALTQAANFLGNNDLSSLAAQQQFGSLSGTGNTTQNFNRGGGGDYGNGNNYDNSGKYGQAGGTLGYNAPSGDNSMNTHFSKKVLVSNLPSSVSYKLLNEKCSEFGEVQGFEAKGPGSVLLTYASDWQAEKAIKNLDRARIDGRMIEARLYL